MLFYLPLILMIVGTTTYHIAQKSVPGAGESCFLAGHQLPDGVGRNVLVDSVCIPSRTAGPGALRSVNWASAAVGVSIVGVELAVLLAYRSGWRVSILSVIGNSASALLLVGIGLAFFHEHLSSRNVRA